MASSVAQLQDGIGAKPTLMILRMVSSTSTAKEQSKSGLDHAPASPAPTILPFSSVMM
jgi:hypothetical protein